MHLVLPQPATTTPGAPGTGADLDDAALRALVEGDRPDGPDLAGRPWVAVNMVVSIDGAATVEGRSGGLGGDGDRRLFGLLRATADVILVGAETVRTERYRLVRRPPEEIAEARRRAGRADRARLCIVSRSGNLGDVPLRAELAEARASGTLDDDERPLLATTPDAVVAGGDATTDPDLETLVLPEPGGGVDLVGLIAELGRRGARHILCEGGPSLLAQLGAAELVDEWNFTIAPTIVGGDAIRPVRSAQPLGQDLRLARLLAEDSVLFARYVRGEHP